MKKFLSLLVFFFPIFVFAQVTSIHPSEVINMNYAGISPKLSDNPSYNGEENIEGPENPSLHNEITWYGDKSAPGQTDNALQKNYSANSSEVKVLSTWDGLGETGGIVPSDNTIVVGQNHVVQMVNSPQTSIRIWDKATGQILINEETVSSIIGVSNLGDPNIIYDPQADRYIFVVLTGNIFSSANITLCISKTPNPTADWYIYNIKCGGLFSSNFPDFPKIGVWGNAYYITTNSGGPYVWVADRNSMLLGQTEAKAQKFTMKDFPGGGIQAASPVTVTGSLDAPADSKAIITRIFDDAWTSGADADDIELYKMDINWSDSKLSTMTGPLKLSIDSYDSYICGKDLNAGSCMPQKGTAQKIDGQGAILNDKCQYINFGAYESFVCTHITDARGDAVAGVRWYELRREPGGEWYIYQQGTYSPDDAAFRFISSVSINQNGDIAAGYNVSGKSLYTGFRITGRLAADDAGQMTAPETIIQNGDAAQGGNRYGDYNGLVNDPSDNSFWFTSNYTTFGGQWATNVVHFEIKQSALPVSFINFTAQKDLYAHVSLNWATANESNNDYFAVERSANGTDFKEIGRVPGAGNSTQAQQYIYIDKAPAAGNNFYRLKQVDKDGKFTLSKQALINMDAATAVKIYPNPVLSKLTITGLNAGGNTTLQVFDMQGKMILQKQISSTDTYTLETSSLKSGNYLLKISNDGIVITKGFVKM